MNHLAIVGAGGVGTAIAFTALNRGLARRISLYDLDGARAEAEALDLRHGLEFVPPTILEGGAGISMCADADVVVVTAGAKQRQGETRLDLAGRNAAMLRQMLPNLIKVAPDALILLVTNPVDVLTQLAVEVTGRDDGTVLGSGTVLDSSRLRHLLAQAYGIAERHIHAHVVGEHGDSEIVLWSSARIGGAPIEAVFKRDGSTSTAKEREEIVDQVRNAAYKVIQGKGATTWAIALATGQILGALDQPVQSAVLPVTAPVSGSDLDLGHVCISLPRRVDGTGAGPILPITATDQEWEAIRGSAVKVGEAVEAVR
ncbi:MAG: L-lactate dehydrogenase [Acidimicrobiia bacterium]